MFKAMDVKSFKKYVKKQKCYIVFETNHMNYIYTSNDKFVSSFAISHSKGSKQYIDPNYVDAFCKHLSKINKE